MLSNYLKIAWRNLKRQKLFSFLNLLGLAIGMAACLLILEYVQYERGFDSFHEKADQVYRVKLDRYNHGELSTEWAGGCAAVGFEARLNLPEVEAFATFYKSSSLLSTNDKQFRYEALYYVTDEVFKVFSYELIAGNPETALKKPFTVVLTEKTARDFFGEEDPMGKTILMRNEIPFKVTGVMKKPSAQSHLKIDALLSFETYSSWNEGVKTAWQWDGFLTYLLLNEGTDTQQFKAKLNQLVQDQQAEELSSFDADMKFHLQPLKAIHLTSDYMAEAEANGDEEAVNMLSIIALFILLLAWINYINLSTARSIRRAKEVGLRKTTGASNSQLVSQFLLESLLLNLIAGIIALTLYQVFRPSLIEISGTPQAFSFWNHPYNWLIFMGILLAGSFLAGLYPAFVLSSFQPANALKGNSGRGAKGINLRKGLVIFQFAISTLLVAGTLAVYQQLQFMQSQDLGVNLEQTLVVRGPAAVDSTYRPRQDAFHEALLRNPKISTIAASTTVPGDPEFSNAGGVRNWGAPESEGNTVAFMWIDHGFMDLFEIAIIEGRNFEKDHFVDTNRVMLNVSATRLFGFEEPADAIGKELYFWGDRVQIVGVVKDYHQKSLKVAGRPTIFRYWPYLTSFHSMRVNTNELSETLAFVEKTFREQFPKNPYEYFFADEYFDRQYSSDQKFSKVFTAFAILAILIACLGLFGLASYALSLRSKEMGIRKVLGASISQLTLLISKDFVLLVIIANILALPLAAWGISEWLTSFPYKMDLQWPLFVIPFILILLIALLTISSQTLKAANTNPVEALRSE